MINIEESAKSYADKLNNDTGEDFDASIEDYTAGAKELIRTLKNEIKKLKANCDNPDKIIAYNSISYLLKEIE